MEQTGKAIILKRLMILPEKSPPLESRKEGAGGVRRSENI